MTDEEEGWRSGGCMPTGMNEAATLPCCGTLGRTSSAAGKQLAKLRGVVQWHDCAAAGAAQSKLKLPTRAAIEAAAAPSTTCQFIIRTEDEAASLLPLEFAAASNHGVSAGREGKHAASACKTSGAMRCGVKQHLCGGEGAQELTRTRGGSVDAVGGDRSVCTGGVGGG